MTYEAASDDYDSQSENIELDDATIDAQEPAGIVEDDESLNSNLKSKSKSSEHSLEVRRAIEDHLERTRLQKDLDYLFDEKFSEDE